MDLRASFGEVVLSRKRRELPRETSTQGHVYRCLARKQSLCMCVDAGQYRILPVDGVCCPTGIIDESLRVGVQRDSEQVPVLGHPKTKNSNSKRRFLGQSENNPVYSATSRIGHTSSCRTHRGAFCEVSSARCLFLLSVIVSNVPRRRYGVCLACGGFLAGGGLVMQIQRGVTQGYKIYTTYDTTYILLTMIAYIRDQARVPHHHAEYFRLFVNTTPGDPR